MKLQRTITVEFDIKDAIKKYVASATPQQKIELAEQLLKSITLIGCDTTRMKMRRIENHINSIRRI